LPEATQFLPKSTIFNWKLTFGIRHGLEWMPS
jgi:hypothetical protein